MTPLVSPNAPRMTGKHSLEWQDQGLCRTYDPSYWDDDQNENSHAATICGSCPVLERQFTTGIHIESDFAGLRNLVQELLNQDGQDE